ncbi:cell wall hydrolase [Sphingomonas sp.]|uniref:cell wall hydrolase n=1 Tax=Sphingomonas sp. TaxID=28214 RepID=UPI003B00F777
MLAPPDPSPATGWSAPATRRASLLALALLASLVLIVFGLSGSPSAVGRGAVRARPAGSALAAAPTPPPPVAPTILADLTPEQARADNAAIGFADEKPKPAPPFLFAGTDVDRAEARACLAAAVLYEAGDDARGEQAVAQVVLNRIRHPAFPKTVCGVVFQGSERSTGCQFTFTCDGALNRPPPEAAWGRARKVADAALAGHVDTEVGAATHYHADYVVPYWRDTLTKLAQVGAHIFYRWPGWWGSSAALTGRLQPFERLDPRLLALAGPEAVAAAAAAAPSVADLGPDAPPTAPAAAPLQSLGVDGVPKAALKGSIVRAKDEAVAQYALQLEAGSFPGSWAVIGFSICADHPDCIVLGWTSEELTPRVLPISPLSMRTLAFMYRKSTALDVTQPSWDCRRYPRADRKQCLPGTAPAPKPPAASAAVAIKPPPAPESH